MHTHHRTDDKYYPPFRWHEFMFYFVLYCIFSQELKQLKQGDDLISTNYGNSYL